MNLYIKASKFQYQDFSLCIIISAFPHLCELINIAESFCVNSFTHCASLQKHNVGWISLP